MENIYQEGRSKFLAKLTCHAYLVSGKPGQHAGRGLWQPPVQHGMAALGVVVQEALLGCHGDQGSLSHGQFEPDSCEALLLPL